MLWHREGFLMEKQTQVRNMSLRSRRLEAECSPTMTLPVEMPQEEQKWGFRVFRADRLIRNLAVVGVLLMTVVALRGSSQPEAQSVFSAIQESAGMEWDESIGKLSFVNSLLPQALQEVWNPQAEVTVFAPLIGEILHVWSGKEPYVTIQGRTDEIRAAANGEVMSVAHGMDEERIIRVRHDDGTEALYGNLARSHVETGQRVYAGDVIATLLENEPLVFELRVDGRSIDPSGRMMAFDE